MINSEESVEFKVSGVRIKGFIHHGSSRLSGVPFIASQCHPGLLSRLQQVSARCQPASSSSLLLDSSANHDDEGALAVPDSAVVPKHDDFF